jgi:hypothetical protein
MGTSVFLRLSDGRRVSLLDNADRHAADAMKAHLEKWVKSGHTVNVTHASGQVEEITPSGVLTIELVDVPTGRTNLDVV